MSETLLDATTGPGGAPAGSAAEAPPAIRLPIRLQQALPISAALGTGLGAAGLPFPLGDPRALATFSGTASVHRAFQAMNLPAGATVLCPSYNCGHELEPLLRMGLRVRCYRVGLDMRVDLEDLRRRMSDDVRAVLVTHYFGFADPLGELRALCDRWGAYLVEDCAHGLLSDNAEGTMGLVGDAAVFSIRKTLPLPHGGAVLFGNASLRPTANLTPPPGLTTWLKSVSLAKKAALDAFRECPGAATLGPVGILAPVMVLNGLAARVWGAVSPAAYDPDDEEFNFDSRILHWGMSPYALALTARLGIDGIAERRRQNYRTLVEALRGVDGCSLVYDELPGWTCPLFLPIVVRDRARAYRALVREGMHSAVWWDQRHPAVEWNDFPEAVSLKNHVLALPVHQDLTPAQVAFAADLLRRILPAV